MLVVIFVVMAATACRGADAETILAPCGRGGEVALVGDDAIDLGGHLGGTTS